MNLLKIAILKLNVSIYALVNKEIAFKQEAPTEPENFIAFSINRKLLQS